MDPIVALLYLRIDLQMPTMSFTRIWTVRFSDTDPFGIAHYPRIVDAIHETSDMFMEKIGWPYWELHDQQELGLPLVSIDFDFTGQVYGGEDIAIELDPIVGESSVQFNYQAAHDSEAVFEGTEHRVCVPTNGDSSVAVPDGLRRALENA